MQIRTKLFGHPVHPILITLPLGLFLFSVAFDIIYLASAVRAFALAAYYSIAGGVVSGLVAAVFGLVDFTSITIQTQAKTIGSIHLFGNLTVLLLFAMSWLLRSSTGPGTPQFLPVALTISGLIVGTATTWLVGEMIDRANESNAPEARTSGSRASRPANVFQASAAPPVPLTGTKKIENKP